MRSGLLLVVKIYISAYILSQAAQAAPFTFGGTFSKYEDSCRGVMRDDSAANIFLLPSIDLFSCIDVSRFARYDGFV